MLRFIFTCWLLGLRFFLHVEAIQIDLDSIDSVKSAAKTITQDLLEYYHGTKPGEIVGILSKPYYWGSAGAVWAGLIDYWQYTGDAQYVDLVQQALLAQVGPDNNYMPVNQTKTEGNDDQAVWALAAMTAAEAHFPEISSSPPWLDFARNVFDAQAARWDDSSCGGGLRWQIFAFNRGYDYKNAISQATFFQLSARLAKYTGNQTYVEWAEKVWDWSKSAGLVATDYKVFDGTVTISNCSEISKLQWTYTAGAFLYGSAVMYNETQGDTQWKDRTQKLLSAISVFFPKATSEIMVEVACENIGTCSDEQHFFKGLTAQWMGSTVQAAPFTANTISNYLQKSAKGVANQCSGGKNGTACGFKWTHSKWDGSQGAGQQLGALNVILANLAPTAPPPFNANSTGSQNSSTPTSNSTDSASTTSPVPSSTSSVTASSKASQVQFTTSMLLLGLGTFLLY